MTTQPRTYTIQDVSAMTCLPSTTLRYYEDIGLLDPIARAANGHRRYTDADLARLDVIKKLRLIGMSLETMVAFVTLARYGPATAAQRCAILKAHRGQVEARIAELQEMLGFIDYKIDLYTEEAAAYAAESLASSAD